MMILNTRLLCCGSGPTTHTTSARIKQHICALPSRDDSVTAHAAGASHWVQSGRTSAPIKPQRVQTILGSRLSSAVSSGNNESSWRRGCTKAMCSRRADRDNHVRECAPR